MVSFDTPETNGHNHHHIESLPKSVPSLSKTVQSSTKFLFKNSDVIFENELLQVGIRGQATKSSMQIELYYGNKSNGRLINFTTNLLPPGDFDPGKNDEQNCLERDHKSIHL